MATDTTITHEELDKKNDHIYFDIRGMISSKDDPGVLDCELLPGERAVREFFVSTKIKNKRPKIMVCCLTILTLGLYHLWIMCCSCMRVKSMGSVRTRCVVTNLGRCLMWRHANAGSRLANACCGMVKGKMQFAGVTDFQWFHLHDVNTVQTLHFRNRPFLCPCTASFGSDHSSYFRIGVGKGYPKQDLLLEGTGGFANQTLITEHAMDWAPATQLIASTAGVGGLSASNSEAKGEMIVEVYSGTKREDSDLPECLSPTWFDESHQDEISAWNDSRAFVNCLVANKVVTTALRSVAPRSSHFRVVDASARPQDLINMDKTVNVHPGVVGLAREEYVIDAVPVYKALTCMEFFTPIIDVFSLMAGLILLYLAPSVGEVIIIQVSSHQWWCCDRQMKSNTALILTNKRLISVTEMNFAAVGEQAFETCGFFLGNVKMGFIIKGAKKRAVGSVQTQYGGLSLDMSAAAGKTINPCGARKMERRAVELWMALASGCSGTTVPAAAVATATAALPNKGEVMEVAKELPLAHGEALLGVVRSKNMWNLDQYLAMPMFKALACGHYDGTRAAVQWLTCGFRPWKLDNFIVLTDRRVFTIGRISNKPCGGFCPIPGKSVRVIGWMPLDNMLSAHLHSVYNMPEAVAAWKRKLAPVFPCLNPAYWELGLRLGVDHKYNDHPFQIQRYQGQAEAGHVDDADLIHFRRVLGAVTAARAAKQASAIIASEKAAGGAAPPGAPRGGGAAGM